MTFTDKSEFWRGDPQLATKMEGIISFDQELGQPTLTDVAKRLRSRQYNYLPEHHQDFCRVIVRRHSEYRQGQFNGIPNELSAILRNEPPVSLRAAAKQLGRNPAYLGSRFPKVCQAISKRYVLFKRKQSWENKKKAVKLQCRFCSHREYCLFSSFVLLQKMEPINCQEAFGSNKLPRIACKA